MGNWMVCLTSPTNRPMNQSGWTIQNGGEEEDGVNSRSDEPEQKTSAPLQRCDPMQAGIRKYGKPRDVASNHPPIQLTIGRAVKVALALVSATESDKMSGNYVISSEPYDRS